MRVAVEDSGGYWGTVDYIRGVGLVYSGDVERMMLLVEDGTQPGPAYRIEPRSLRDEEVPLHVWWILKRPKLGD